MILSLLEAALIVTATSAAVSLMILATTPAKFAHHFAGALAFAISYFAVYYFLAPKHLSPTTYWHWLPWLAAIGSIVGAVATYPRRVIGWILTALFALGAAWLLVPTWKSLQNQRTTQVVIFAAFQMAFPVVLDRPSQRASGLPVSMALLATSLFSSLVVGIEGSLRMGELGAAGAGALTGAIVGILWKRDHTIIRSLLPAHTAVLTGILFTAMLGDTISATATALFLISPAMLWLFEFGKLAQLRGIKFVLARALAVGIPLVAGTVLSLVEFGKRLS